MFIKTVSAISSALWPVTILFAPKRIAPLSNAYLLKTPQKVQLPFKPKLKNYQFKIPLRPWSNHTNLYRTQF